MDSEFQGKRLLYKSSLILSAEVFHNLVSVVILFFITRKYLPYDIGIYLFAFSFTELFLIIVSFGSGRFLMREIARDKTKTAKYLGNIFGLRVLFSLICLVLLLGITGVFFKQAILMTAIVSVPLIINQVTFIFSSIFYAHGKIFYAIFVGISSRTLLILLFFPFLKLDLDIIYLPTIHILSSIYFFTVSCFIQQNKITRFRLEIDLKFWGEILKKCLPFLILGISSMIYFKLDTIMISKIRGFEEAAFYDSPLRIITALLFIPYSFFPIVYPGLSQLIDKKSHFRNMYKRVLKQLITISCVLTLFFFFFSKFIIGFLFGEEFFNSWKVLSILSLSIPFIFINTLNTVSFLSINREKEVIYILTAVVLVKIILNLFFIPPYGFIAGAVTTLITAILLLFCLNLFLYKYYWREPH